MPDETQNPGAEASGDVEIEMPPELYRAGAGGKNLIEDSLREIRYEKELQKLLADKGLDTYDKLADYYKDFYKVVGTDGLSVTHGPAMLDRESIDNASFKTTVKSHEGLDTVEELKAGLKDLMKTRDYNNERYQELETRYGKEIEDLDAYEGLAHYYKALYGVLNHGEFPGGVDFERFKQTDLKNFEHLNTKEELKRALTVLMEERDYRVELSERYDWELEEFDTYEKLAEHYKDIYKELNKDAPDIPTLEGKDLKDIKGLDTYAELKYETQRLMEQHDNRHNTAVRIENVEQIDPVKLSPLMDYSKDVPGGGDVGKDASKEYERDQLEMQKTEMLPPDSDEQEKEVPLVGKPDASSATG